MSVAYWIRQATEADLFEVADLDYEAFSPYGTAETPTVFAARLKAFSEGFIVLISEGVTAGYGCSEKWQCDRDPVLDEDPTTTHHPDGRVFCITGMAVRLAQRGKGFGLALLDRLIQIARDHHCQRIVLETTHAQGLYFKRGFRIIRERQQSGVILSIMQLDLIDSTEKQSFD
jgi:ribosomal protein S18 acetylase RimI-like enzyme